MARLQGEVLEPVPGALTWCPLAEGTSGTDSIGFILFANKKRRKAFCPSSLPGKNLNGSKPVFVPPPTPADPLQPQGPLVATGEVKRVGLQGAEPVMVCWKDGRRWKRNIVGQVHSTGAPCLACYAKGMRVFMWAQRWPQSLE